MLNITLMYASEKFSNAVGAMAASTDSLHVRLARAWMNDLSMILMNDVSNLPTEIQYKLADLSAKLFAGELKGAGPDIESLVNALDESQVRAAIARVIDLYDSIISAYALGGPKF